MAFGKYHQRQKKCRPVPAGYQSDKVKIDNDDYSTSVTALQEEIQNRLVPKRVAAEELSTMYEFIEGDRGGELEYCLDRRIPALRNCGTFLEYHVSPDRIKLSAANFCHDRLCPMCNWRRSLKMFGQISRVMDVLEEKENFRYLFLTLTVRNCVGEDLSDTISLMFDGWQKMYQSRGGPFRGKHKVVEGTLRILEVTYNHRSKTFHPHIHMILAVSPDYFSGQKYITASEWVQMWRQVCGLDYDPVCFIEKIQPVTEGERGGIKGAVAEVAKYPFKDADWQQVHGSERLDVLVSLLNGLRGRRLVGFTGCFWKVRQMLGLDDVENGDLVNVEDLRDDVRDVVVRCHWCVGGRFGSGGYAVHVLSADELAAELESQCPKEYHVPEGVGPAIPVDTFKDRVREDTCWQVSFGEIDGTDV